ncbi:putative heterokaryon incompatibility protein [Botrytis fragariae]|uniref:Putative heterokaryon incompatibility protein n=1 Tax=Botrytis fragariae TaxID=1964551 RepID=A0A8H6B5A5_9HELO|nr:putative heterokaryon incompatibility protein [Botrytis fragariae]KAF5879651.1 putative heterokaryon incompatibility protein [Botrytis fragariae]
MTPYSQPLSLSNREIRILILQPLSQGTPIQCTVETISLLSHPSYEALSYVWGDASIRQTITFNDTPFSVTQNLAIALHHLRLPLKPRRLWVDAICINQSDIKERNEQVTLMGEIYSLAKPALVWLGETFEGCKEAFDLMSKIAIASEDEIIEEESQTLFSFYIELVKKEWFTRLWTIQELALADQEPLVGCGFTWTTWSVLSKVWQKVAMIEFTKMGMVMMECGDENENANKTAVSQGVRTSTIKIDLLNNLRTAVTDKKGEDLRDLLLNTVTSKATEPKDRIYGLLGMMSSSDRKAITVDYNRPLGTIYADAISHIFHKGRGPSFLSGLELAGPKPPFQYPAFPSWVPRLGSETLLHSTLYHPPGIGVSGAGSTAINGHISPDLKTLYIRGLPIDTIAEKFTFGPDNECLTQLSHVEEMVLKAKDLAILHSHYRPYLHTFKTKEPVWRTLVTNKLYTGAGREVAPEAYGEMYDILLNQNTQDHNTNRNIPSQDKDSSHNYIDKIRDYRLSLLNRLPNSAFFITTTGFYGVAPKAIEIGDQLAIWFGAAAPLVLRRWDVKGQKPSHDVDSNHSDTVKVEGERNREGNEKEQSEIFAAVTVAYVAGIMDGEIVDEVYCEDLEEDVVFTVR